MLLLLYDIHSISSVINGATDYNFPTQDTCTEVSFRI